MFKLTANKEDVIKFSIFSIAMFLLIAIIVNNITVFSRTGEFAGLNPFAVFLDLDTFLLTMIVTIVALLSIIFGTSSQFFEKEKGFGFGFAKKDKGGYSRWATEKEFKGELKHIYADDKVTDVAGIPLINNGHDIWVDNGEFHNLIIGSTGSGKTEMLVQPMVKILAKKGESMIITDPKGEIYEKNANELREKGYNVVLLNFRDPQRGNSWNPLTLPYELYRSGNHDKANELLDDLAMNILYDEKSQNQDPFWERTSADYFTGLALGLFEDAKEEEINLNSINLMTTVGEDKLMASTYIKEYFSFKDPASPAYVNVSSTIMAPSDTKNSILSVFKQKIKLFASRENLSEMLSRSDFDMKDIGRKKTAVFVVIQDEKKTYHSLVTIFIKQCYETLIDVAQENGGKLEYRTNFILDEFANMPPLKDVTTMVTAARSRRIRFSFIIQNFAQLSQVYGQENGDTIRGNCGNIIYLISSEMKALEEISKMCGEVKSKEKDKTASTPLVTVSDLQRLKLWTIIVLRTRCMPFKTVLKPNFEMEKANCWGKKYDKASYPTRTENQIKIFDLKAFVNKKREEKLGGGTASAAGGGMFGGFGASPYGGFNSPFPSPFGNEKKSNQPEFDIDAIVKKIDAKIAELEEEEKQEQENANKTASTPLVESSKNVNYSDLDSKINNLIEENKTKETINVPYGIEDDTVESDDSDDDFGSGSSLIDNEVADDKEVDSYEDNKNDEVNLKSDNSFTNVYPSHEPISLKPFKENASIVKNELPEDNDDEPFSMNEFNYNNDSVQNNVSNEIIDDKKVTLSETIDNKTKSEEKKIYDEDVFEGDIFNGDQAPQQATDVSSNNVTPDYSNVYKKYEEEKRQNAEIFKDSHDKSNNSDVTDDQFFDDFFDDGE